MERLIEEIVAQANRKGVSSLTEDEYARYVTAHQAYLRGGGSITPLRKMFDRK